MKYLFSALLLFCCYTSPAQMPEVYETKPSDGNCPVSVSLYPDGSFFYKDGCEASPRLSFGKWTREKDRLHFEPVNPLNYKVIENITASTVPGDSVWLTILDKDGANVSQKISAGLEISGRGSYMFSNNDSGTKKFVYRRNGGRIVLRTLNKLFGQRLELPTDTANNFVLLLNVKSEWLTSVHADWASRTGFSLLKKGDELVSSQPSVPKQAFRKKEQQN